MQLEALDRRAWHDGPLQRLDSRIKLIFTLAFVVVIVLTPVGLWRPLAAEGLILAFLIGLSQVPPGELLARWSGFVVLVGFLAAMAAGTHPQTLNLGWFTVWICILAKNSLAFLTILTLAGTTPFPRILVAMRSLGVPAILVSTLHFMSRYINVLGDELHRMTQARRSRSFQKSGRLDWILLTGLIGKLLIRSLERGERVHSAMLARGWDGTIRSLDAPEVASR